MNTIKTQALGKRLLIPLLLIEMATMGVGLSFPAQSTSPRSEHSTSITVKPKSTQILISSVVVACMKEEPKDELSPQATPTTTPMPRPEPPRAPKPPKPKSGGC